MLCINAYHLCRTLDYFWGEQFHIYDLFCPSKIQQFQFVIENHATLEGIAMIWRFWFPKLLSPLDIYICVEIITSLDLSFMIFALTRGPLQDIPGPPESSYSQPGHCLTDAGHPGVWKKWGAWEEGGSHQGQESTPVPEN